MTDQLKDLAEHARTVHFTTLLIAITIIAATLKDYRRVAIRAHEDARSIYNLASIDVGRLIEAAADKAAGEKSPESTILSPVPGYFRSGSKAFALNHR